MNPSASISSGSVVWPIVYGSFIIRAEGGDVVTTKEHLRKHSKHFEAMGVREPNNDTETFRYPKEIVELLLRLLDEGVLAAGDYPHLHPLIRLMDEYAFDSFYALIGPCIEANCKRGDLAGWFELFQSFDFSSPAVSGLKRKRDSDTLVSLIDKAIVGWKRAIAAALLKELDLPVKENRHFPGTFSFPLSDLHHFEPLWQELPFSVTVWDDSDLANITAASPLCIVCLEREAANVQKHCIELDSCFEIKTIRDVPVGMSGFGVGDWRQYCGDIGEVPLLPDAIVQRLECACPYFSNQKVKDTHILVLIPERVSGRPLTLRLLRTLIQDPHGGGIATDYRYCDARLDDEHGNRSAVASRWVLMLKDVIPGSLKQSFANASRYLKPSYQVPDLVSAAVCIGMHFVKTGKPLFTNTYTYCAESVAGKLAIVGGFDPGDPFDFLSVLVPSDFDDPPGFEVRFAAMTDGKVGFAALKAIDYTETH